MTVEFPTSVIERLGYYVYTLADPKTGKVFYVGKGTGNRVFAHATEAIRNPVKSDKLDRIRRIRASGRNVKYEIIRHGMTEKEAFEVESALIDFVGLKRLSNKVAGQDMDSRGRMTVAEIIAAYGAKPITIAEPALLIIVNKLFEHNISPERLYEITCGNWVLGERRNKAKYAFSVFRGVVREVYRINGWFPVQARSPEQKRQSRWRFEGEVAQEKKIRHYVGGSVEAYLKPGAQSPVKYVNC
ncbi:MAG: hypothetical protein HY259_03965 [Chloroflexi bacterium]|nr:hypothetical protein [Chloroflexota bacterium]